MPLTSDDCAEKEMCPACRDEGRVVFGTPEEGGWVECAFCDSAQQREQRKTAGQTQGVVDDDIGF